VFLEEQRESILTSIPSSKPVASASGSSQRVEPSAKSITSSSQPIASNSQVEATQQTVVTENINEDDTFGDQTSKVPLAVVV
jgi:hypothetical protein